MVNRTSQIIDDPVDLARSPGPTSLDSDPLHSSRETSQRAAQSTWELCQGTVQYSVPGLGWHRIALANGMGIVTAASTGRVDAFGAKTSQAYQAGSDVVVAVDKATQTATIIGQMPYMRTDSTMEFDQPTFVGSWSNAGADPTAEVYASTKDGGGLAAYENGMPSDQLGGDYRIGSSFGVQFFVSPLESGLFSDDVTGLWVNLLDQSVEISGRQVEIQSDGVSLANNLHTKFAKFQLTGELSYHEEPVLINNEKEISDLEKQDNGFVYAFESEDIPVELYMYNLYALPSSAATHIAGTHLVTGDGQEVSLLEGADATYPDISVIEHPPGAEDDADEWLPPPNADQSIRDEVVDNLDSWLQTRDDLHFTKLLAAIAEVGKDWLADSRHFLRHKQHEIEGGGDSAADAFIRSESVQQVTSEGVTDRTFGGEEVVSNMRRAGWIVKQGEDGSLFLGNEHGAGIRIVGSGVFIEGGTVRVAAAKDLNVMARDVNILSNRDVNLTAKTNLRAFSEKNVAISSGSSGEGGVLIESRGSNREVVLPDDPQKAVYSGVALKSHYSQVVAYGGDVVLAAGATGAGQLVMRSDGGPAAVLTPFQFVVHSSGQLGTFGDETRPSSANYISASAAAFGGDIYGCNFWGSGQISASGSIQSFFGRMADSVGGQIGKVRNVSLFNRGIRSFQENISQGAAVWQDSNQTLRENLFSESRPLNRQVRAELSTGYVSPSAAEKHFGSQNMQPTYMAVFQDSWGYPTSALTPQRLIYKPGTSSEAVTHSWPGNADSLQISVPVGVGTVKQRLDAMLSGQGEPVEFQPRSFGAVFRTLGDNNE